MIMFHISKHGLKHTPYFPAALITQLVLRMFKKISYSWKTWLTSGPSAGHLCVAAIVIVPLI